MLVFIYEKEFFLINRLKYYYYQNKVENESALHQKLLVKHHQTKANQTIMFIKNSVSWI
jgi:hypothetical protein